MDLADEPDDVVEALRTLAARERAPAIYQWVAEEKAWDPVLLFLALEGGPDDIFDDLVATCQVGLPLGPAKMKLANNYWDEMGNGNFEDVHNVLYRRFVEAVDLPVIRRQRTADRGARAQRDAGDGGNQSRPAARGARCARTNRARPAPSAASSTRDWADWAPTMTCAPSTRCTRPSIHCTAKDGWTTPSPRWWSTSPTGARTSCEAPPGSVQSTRHSGWAQQTLTDATA